MRPTLRGIHTARRTAPRSSASNSEIETGAIRAAKSALYGAVRRVAALIIHVYKHDSAPCGAVLRRAAPYGAQCECHFNLSQ